MLFSYGMKTLTRLPAKPRQDSPRLQASHTISRCPIRLPDASPCYAKTYSSGGNVIKILLLIVIGFVAWTLIRNYQRSLNHPSKPSRKDTVEDMVKCAHCGVNLPRSEAIYSGGHFFCTPEHQRLGKT
jgi:uncharacterized protein